MAKNISVFGIYADRTPVSDARDVLHQGGYRATDISVLLPDNQGSKDFAHEKNTKAPEGATTGAAAGVVLGAVLAGLVAVGVFAIPGLGPFVAAGPVIGRGAASKLNGETVPIFQVKRHSGASILP